VTNEALEKGHMHCGTVLLSLCLKRCRQASNGNMQAIIVVQGVMRATTTATAACMFGSLTLYVRSQFKSLRTNNGCDSPNTCATVLKGCIEQRQISFIQNTRPLMLLVEYSNDVFIFSYVVFGKHVELLNLFTWTVPIIEALS
jgi:hypothetical protein